MTKGETLRRIRLMFGYSIKELSGINKVSRPHIGMIENGSTNVGIIVLEKYAKGLEIDPAEIFSLLIANEECKKSQALKNIFEIVIKQVEETEKIERE